MRPLIAALTVCGLLLGTTHAVAQVQGPVRPVEVVNFPEIHTVEVSNFPAVQDVSVVDPLIYRLFQLGSRATVVSGAESPGLGSSGTPIVPVILTLVGRRLLPGHGTTTLTTAGNTA